MAMTPAVLAMILGGSAAFGGLTQGIGGAMQSSAARDASLLGAEGNVAQMGNIYNAGQQAQAYQMPYLTGGQGNYDLLQYLLGGNAPTATQWTSDQEAQLKALQDKLSLYQASSRFAAKNPGALTAVQGDIDRLMQQKTAAEASQKGAQNIASSGLPQGYLSNIPQFTYNAMTDPNLRDAVKLASQEIGAQKSATGGYGSGNMASELMNETAMLEPQFEQLALGEYNTNVYQPRQALYNYLTGNTAGAGGQAATNIGNMLTGTAATAAPYGVAGSNALASGAMSSIYPYTNAMTNLSNTATSGAGLYLQNQQQQQFADILKNYLNPAGNSPTSGIWGNSAENIWSGMTNV